MINIEYLMEDAHFYDIMCEDIVEEVSYLQALKFEFKNFDVIIKNFLADAQNTGNFEKLHDNLLKMVSRCRTINDLEYIRKDLSTAKQFLTKYAEIVKNVETGKTEKMNISMVSNIEKRIRKGLSSKKIIDHKKWIDTVYSKAINDKAKEIRNK